MHVHKLLLGLLLSLSLLSPAKAAEEASRDYGDTYTAEELEALSEALWAGNMRMGDMSFEKNYAKGYECFEPVQRMRHDIGEDVVREQRSGDAGNHEPAVTSMMARSSALRTSGAPESPTTSAPLFRSNSASAAARRADARSARRSNKPAWIRSCDASGPLPASV